MANIRQRPTVAAALAVPYGGLFILCHAFFLDLVGTANVDDVRVARRPRPGRNLGADGTGDPAAELRSAVR